MAHQCKICGASSDDEYVVKETRQRTFAPFVYFKCPDCGCLQIAEIPADMDIYYRGYYAVCNRSASEMSLKSFVRRQLFDYLMNGRNVLGRLVRLFDKESFNWIIPGLMDFNSSILDVGCGSGRLLIKMGNSGFTNLSGMDPFIDCDLSYTCATADVCVKKETLFEISSQYDLIMMHHVLEHMDDQHAVFRKIRTLMHDGSRLLLNIPVIDSFAWDEYGTNCFQLADAPRHFFLHTSRSIALLASRYGFKIDGVRHFASPMIFTTSEMTCDGISFSKRGLCVLRKEARRLADEKRSGLVCFYLSIA